MEWRGGKGRGEGLLHLREPVAVDSHHDGKGDGVAQHGIRVHERRSPFGYGHVNATPLSVLRDAAVEGGLLLLLLLPHRVAIGTRRSSSFILLEAVRCLLV